MSVPGIEGKAVQLPGVCMVGCQRKKGLLVFRRPFVALCIPVVQTKNDGDDDDDDDCTCHVITARDTMFESRCVNCPMLLFTADAVWNARD